MALSAKTTSLINKALASKGAGAELRVAIDANTTAVVTLRARHAALVARMTTAAAATTTTLRILCNTILTKLKTGNIMSSS